jgi:phosphopantetheine--protein transferase-like protein
VDFPGHALDDLRLPDGDAAIHAGVDMVELDRFGRILAMGGEEFLATVYTAREREHCDGRLERLATRFAAKEAASKALGTGLRDIGLLEIEVVSEANGRPHLEFHGRARDRAGEHGGRGVRRRARRSCEHNRTIIAIAKGEQTVTELKRSRPADDGTSPDEAYASMGARLREAREFLGLSQEVVAEALGVPRASVSAMESGRRKVSSLELRDLARLYKRPIDFFYNDERGDETVEDEATQALYRATRNLTPDDKEQVVRFAEFLKGAGQAPARRRSQ